MRKFPVAQKWANNQNINVSRLRFRPDSTQLRRDKILGTKALPSLQPEDRLASSPLLALPTCAILSGRRKNGPLSRYYACGDDTRSASQRFSDISFLAARSHEIGAFQLEVG